MAVGYYGAGLAKEHESQGMNTKWSVVTANK